MGSRLRKLNKMCTGNYAKSSTSVSGLVSSLVCPLILRNLTGCEEIITRAAHRRD